MQSVLRLIVNKVFVIKKKKKKKKLTELWEGVAQKVDGDPVTRANFLNIRHLPLRVFDLG